jgi:plasmid stabilization system protein ParE
VKARRVIVRITANFERNLDALRDFLAEAGAPSAFEDLIGRLESRVIPAIERFPDIGADFAAKAPLSREGQVLFERLVALAGPNGEVRQLVEGDYIVLYLVRDNHVLLLSIKHHLQLSFDFPGHWPKG